jgi:hypothetical protein
MRHAHGASARGSYPQARPPGNDGLGCDAVDDHQLLTARRPGHDPDIATGNPEFVGQETDQGLVGGTFDRRRGDPDPEHAPDDAIDSVGRRSWGEPDGEPRVENDRDP